MSRLSAADYVGLTSTAQSASSNGSLQGVVTDRDGALYQGVLITLTQTAPVLLPDKTASSDSNGRFAFAGVPPGSFVLTISSEGFATQKLAGIMRAGETYQMPPIVLLVSTATSEVRVTGTQLEVAQEQLHEEEQQRVLGFIPNFYVAYGPNVAPLNSRQKFHLAWRSSIDPVTILISGVTAGVEQENNDFRGYGQGVQGYAKRFGADYGNNVIGTMLGGAVLPSLLKQDPRYYYKGIGSNRSRALYAIANSVICKGDNGHWQMNYSAIAGGLAAAGISNLYYPDEDRNGAALTFENALIGTAETAVGNLFQEFVVRKFTPHLPGRAPAKP